MKRKLINFDVFNKIHENSLLRAESELVKAESLLGKTLGLDEVKLYSFTGTDVTYHTLNETFVHANYKLDGNHVIFENIEELVVDDKSERKHARQILQDMVENVLKNENSKASDLFSKYMSLPNVRRELKEGAITEACKTKMKKKKKEFPFKWKGKKMKMATKKMLSEWHSTAKRAETFMERKESGPALRGSSVRKDERGNVVALRIPNSQKLNEGKVQHMNYDVLNTEVKVIRNKIKNEVTSAAFCRAMSELRQTNAVSDHNGLEEGIEKIVKSNPNLIYLSHQELSEAIRSALEMIGDTHYDDNQCSFLAEGLLRKATEAYEERVSKILRIAGTPVNPKQDVYEQFQNVVSRFYPALDEMVTNEMQIYVDLYNTLVEVHKTARLENNEAIKEEATVFLKEFYNIVSHGKPFQPDLAVSASEWLINLTETNLETSPWDVSNSTHRTVNGSNPASDKLSKVGYTPSSDFSGDFGNGVPGGNVSDGKNWKSGDQATEMKDFSWGYFKNAGVEDDVYPQLKNPLEKGSDGAWKMTGMQNVVDDPDPFGSWSSDKTFPNLENPVVPKGETPNTYKMKNSDLVVDA